MNFWKSIVGMGSTPTPTPTSTHDPTNNNNNNDEEEEQSVNVYYPPSGKRSNSDEKTTEELLHICDSDFVPDEDDNSKKTKRTKIIVQGHDKEDDVVLYNPFSKNDAKVVDYNDHDHDRGSFDKAEAKLYSGVVEFENVYNNFQTTTVQQFRDRFEPPHVVDLTDEELQRGLDYERKRMQNRDEILQDAMYDFIVLVTGNTRTPLNRALPLATQINRDEYGLPIVRAGIAATGTGTTSTGAVAPAIGPAVSPYTGGGILGSPPYIKTPRHGRPADVGVAPIVAPGDYRARQLATEAEELQKANNNLRITTAYPWMEKIEVIGRLALSSEIYSAARNGFAKIKNIQQLETFHELDDFYPLIYTSVQEVRAHFADITRWHMANTNFFFPSKTPLDKNHQRIWWELQQSFMSLAEYEWNPYAQEFQKKSGSRIASKDPAAILLRKK